MSMKDPKNQEKEKETNKQDGDWDLGTPQNSCSLNKTPDDDCESCQ